MRSYAYRRATGRERCAWVRAPRCRSRRGPALTDLRGVVGVVTRATRKAASSRGDCQMILLVCTGVRRLSRVAIPTSYTPQAPLLLGGALAIVAHCLCHVMSEQTPHSELLGLSRTTKAPGRTIELVVRTGSRVPLVRRFGEIPRCPPRCPHPSPGGADASCRWRWLAPLSRRHGAHRQIRQWPVNGRTPPAARPSRVIAVRSDGDCDRLTHVHVSTAAAQRSHRGVMP